MTVGVSVANLGNKWLSVLSGTNFTAPATLYVKLHTGDPGSAGANNAAVGDATRRAAAWNAASAGSISMSGTIVWTNGGTSETISHISVWDAASAGNFIFSAALTASQAWISTNSFTLNTLSVSLTPLAA